MLFSLSFVYLLTPNPGDATGVIPYGKWHPVARR